MSDLIKIENHQISLINVKDTFSDSTIASLISQNLTSSWFEKGGEEGEVAVRYSLAGGELPLVKIQITSGGWITEKGTEQRKLTVASVTWEIVDAAKYDFPKYAQLCIENVTVLDADIQEIIEFIRSKIPGNLVVSHNGLPIEHPADQRLWFPVKQISESADDLS